jgi:hypothetical protein
MNPDIKTFSIISYVDNSNFIIAIACLASVQAVMIIVIGLCTFVIYKRKDSSCCHVRKFIFIIIICVVVAFLLMVVLLI